jgi:hypothetical protein
MSNTFDTTELEQHRQQLLKEIEKPSNYQPGSFGCHELLDRLSVVSANLEEYVCGHPACVLQAAWYASASEAATILANLYQKIGGEHLSAMPADSTDAPEPK